LPETQQKLRKTNLSTFPYRTSALNADNWKDDFEKATREVLTNLEKETNVLRNCKSEALSRDFPMEADAYEHLICHNEGRIFSLKQILGDLPS
jgi:hypothetical protein